MKKIEKNRDVVNSILLILVLVISLGYAYLNSNLNITGTSHLNANSWNIYWDNIVLGSNNVTSVNTPATISSGLTEVTFNVNFQQPGDTYEFTVDAVNDGSINAMVSVVSNGVFAANGTTPKTLPAYLEYTVTYSDGAAIAQNHLLEAGETETYKVRVHYKEDITASQLPSTSDNYVFKFSVTYVQADSNAIPAPHPTSFTEDDWSTIVMAVQTGNTGVYHVGDTKTVDMGNLGTHTLRIANTTTPAECSTTGFSGTACGFVLEFADIITTHNMNSTNTNVGGWPASEMRTYINSDIYNALPSALKNGIINTTVVSGHGSSDSNDFTSTDKLYLLSPVEVWGYNSYSQNDTARNLSRQIDYYSDLEVNNTNYSAAIKPYQDSSDEWWYLRTASAGIFLTVDQGGYFFVPAQSIGGVSPAFRLG